MDAPLPKTTEEMRLEIQELRKELARMTMQRCSGIFKKNDGHSVRAIEERYRMVEQFCSQYPVRELCLALGSHSQRLLRLVSRAGDGARSS